MIPGASPAPAAPPTVEAPAPPKEFPQLPELNESTVNAALVERAKQAAADFPEEPALRTYVGAAYLILALSCCFPADPAGPR